jgi:two-component system nitrate/nitrite response regulator NarL
MRVLMIDDHALFRMGLSELLQRRGIEVVAALGDCEKGIQWVEENSPDVVLLDMRMPVMSGLEVLQELRRRQVGMPVVMLTTSRDESECAAEWRARLSVEGYGARRSDYGT